MGGTTHFGFARLAVLEGQGHYYYFSAPEETNHIIRAFIYESAAGKAFIEQETRPDGRAGT